MTTSTSSTRYPLLLLLFLLPLLLHLPTRTAAAAIRPHIVIFLADDIGWSDVSLRDKQMKTPNIDRLARDGIILENSYMQEGGIPSRAAFFSGYYPVHLGLQHAALNPTPSSVLPLDVKIFPEELKALGYSTHYVGKWHLGASSNAHKPTSRGFDTFYGMYGGEADYFTHTTPSGVYDMHSDAAPDKFSVDLNANGTYSTSLFTSKAIQIIKNHDKKTPLLLVVSHQAAHKPLQAPRKYVRKCDTFTGGAKRKSRCAVLAGLDHSVRKVESILRKKGFTSNLISLFISDNGGDVEEGASNYPLRGTKGTLWEGGTKAVTFLRSDKYLPQNATGTSETTTLRKAWHGMMHAVDWYPTILGMAGSKKELVQIDGVNNWDAIARNESSNRWEFLVGWNDLTKDYAYRYDDVKVFDIQQNLPDDVYFDVKNNYANVSVKTKTGFLYYELNPKTPEQQTAKTRGKACIINMLKLKLQSMKARLLPAV